jgi:TPR repeat protein
LSSCTAGHQLKDTGNYSEAVEWFRKAANAGHSWAHNSKAVHRAYARKAHVVIPTLEEHEGKFATAENVIVPMPATVA